MALKCPNPECGQEDYFHITCKVTCEVRSDGSRLASLDDLMYDDTNYCCCPECGDGGTVEFFTVKEGDSN